MKKKLFIALALACTFTLASCGDDVIVTETTKDRGQEEEFTDVTIPDVLRPTESDENQDTITYTVNHNIETSDGSYKTVLVETLFAKKGEMTNVVAKEYTGYSAEEITQEEIKADGSTVITIQYNIIKYTISLGEVTEGGSIAGSGTYSSLDGAAKLTAKPNIGYEFTGWYDGSELLSTQETYEITLTSDMDITGQFQIASEFLDYQFVSTETTCTVTRFLNERATVVEIPEGVTEIATHAFSSGMVKILTLPKTLKTVNTNAFYTPGLLKLTINSNCTMDSNEFFSSDVEEVFDLSTNGHTNSIFTYVTLHTDATERSDFTVDDAGFIWQDKYNDSNEHVLYLCGRTDEKDGELVLPSSYTRGEDTWNEYEIKNNAFNFDSLRVLTLPNAVININDNAFYGCQNLVELYNFSSLAINLNPKTNSNGCINYYLKAIHTDENDENVVLSEGDFDYILQDRAGTTYAEIINYRGSEESLTIHKIKDYPTYIGEGAFLDNETLKSVTITSDVQAILDEAFSGCTNLEYISASDVEFVGERAFINTKLKEASLPSCEQIDQYAFQNVATLRSISLDKVKDIGSYAFSGCKSLYQFTFPATLTTVGENAFKDCINIIEVINQSTIDITDSSASGGVSTYSLSNITDEADTMLLVEDDFVIAQKNDNYALVAYIGSGKDIVLPEKISAILSYSLAYLELDSLTISKELSYYGTCAFYGASIKEIDIYLSDYIVSTVSSFLTLFTENSYTSINVDTLVVRGSLTKVPSNYFSGIYASTISFPNTVTEIEYNGFKTYSIDNIYFNGTQEEWNNITLNEYLSFFTYNNNPNLYFKDEEGDVTFKGTTYSLFDILVIPAGTTEITSEQYQYYTVKEIILPEGVTTIGEYAFRGCSNLEKINLPSTLTSIGYSAFDDCSNLYDISLPSSIESISNFAFKGTAITSITLPESLTSLGRDVFQDCSKLMNAVYNTTLNIPYGLFSGCTLLQSVKINTEITSIGGYAFKDCKALRKINLPNTITNIESDAFKSSGLKSIDLSSLELPSISSGLFADCKNLTSISLPDTITSVGDEAFKNTGLTSFTFPSTVSEVSSSAFYGCTSLESIVLSEGVTTINDNAFEACKKLKTVSFPSTLEAIYAEAFKGCTQLNNLSFSDSLTHIDDNVFESCTYLSDITLPTQLEYLGKNVFLNDDNMVYTEYENGYYLGDSSNLCRYFIMAKPTADTVTINEETNLLAGTPFSGLTVTKIIIPSSVSKLPEGVFLGAEALKEVEVPFIGDNAGYKKFDYFFSYQTSSIPETLTKVTLNSGTYLGDNAFYGCKTIEEVILPSTLTEIGSYAFRASGIVDITIPSSVTTIGNYVFGECEALKSVSFPNLTKIGAYLFKNATAIESIVLPDTLTSIGNFAFEGCTSLSSINIPSGVTKIPNYAFNECTSLKEISLPTSITSIGTNSFQNSGLRSFVVQSGITEIGSNAFYGCTRLFIVCNLSTLEIVAGDTSNGYVGYYAKSISKDLENVASLTVASDFEFLIDDTNAYLISYTGDTSEAKDFVLPSSVEYNNKTYTSYTINKEAFKDAKYINALVIPSAVKAIEDSAFYNARITSITFQGDSITSVGESAFAHCNSLAGDLVLPAGNYVSNAFESSENITSVSFKEGATTIGDNMFSFCTSLESVALAEGLTTIGEKAFYYIPATEITIPATVTSIGNRAFYNSYIETVNLKEGSKLEEIGEYAFNYIELSGTLPNTLTTIGEKAFYYYQGTSITIPASVTSIGSHAFHNSLLESVIINCDSMGEYMFYASKSLTSVTFNGAITEIPTYAFANCEALASITIPNTVEYIGEQAFYATGLESITVPSSVIDMADQIFSTCNSLVTANINADIEVLPESTFVNCSALKNVTLSNSMTTIGENAFAYCSGLEAITLPENIVNLSKQSFYFCDSLNNVVLNSGTTTIPEQAFYHCVSLTNLTLPDSVTSIQKYAFGYAGFVDLVIWDSITNINENAFANCQYLKSVTVPATVTTMGEWVFSHCPLLESVKFFGTTGGIENYTFYDCPKLTTVQTDAIVIQSNAFKDCDSLSKIYQTATSYVSFTVESGNESFTAATVYWYSLEEPTSDGNYWHYDSENNIVEW